MHDQSYMVYRLAAHLPNEQLVDFQDGQVLEAMERAQNRFTHLTAKFEVNKHDLDARKFLNLENPDHYVFDKFRTIWKVRQRGGNKVILRMYSVSPKIRNVFT